MNRRLLVVAIAIGLTACSAGGAAEPVSTTAAGQQTSDLALQASVQRLAAAWNAGDGNRWAAEYWPDGSLINILGAVFPDAAAVAAVTSTILAGPFKGSVLVPAVRRVRYLGPSVAIVETDASVTNFRALPPGAVATKPGLLLTRLTHVYENRNGVWKIEASQNTAVLP